MLKYILITLLLGIASYKAVQNYQSYPKHPINIDALAETNEEEIFFGGAWNPCGRDKPSYSCEIPWQWHNPHKVCAACKGRDMRGNKVGTHDAIHTVFERTC